MLCRLCLHDTEESICMFDSNGVNLDVVTIVSKYFWFKPQMDDPISNIICNECWSHLHNFHVFYMSIELAQKGFLEKPVYDLDSDKPDVCIYLKKEDLNDYCSEEINTNPITDDLDFTEYDQKDLADESVQDDENKDNKDFLTISDDNLKSRRITRSAKIKKETTEEASLDPCEIAENKPVKRKVGRPRKIENKKANKSEKHAMYYKISKDFDDIISKNMKLSCNVCHMELSNFAQIKRHFRSAHKKRGYAVCCNKKLYKRALLVDHINTHLNPEYFKCVECNKVLADRQCLRNHVLTLHQSEEQKIFHCQHCSKKFAKQYLLDHHKHIHIPTEERKFCCEICGKNFPTEPILKMHTNYVHVNAYGKMCHICAKVIRGKAAFERHQLEHEGITEPEVQCEKCGSWLKDKYSLRKHMYRHRDEKIEHTCDFCGKTAPTRSALRSHLRYVHESQRKHNCGVCDKAFKRAVALKEHMTTHTGEVLYTCPHCPKTFNSKANMHSHRKKAHRKEWEENRRNMRRKTTPDDSNDKEHSVEVE